MDETHTLSEERSEEGGGEERGKDEHGDGAVAACSRRAPCARTHKDLARAVVRAADDLLDVRHSGVVAEDVHRGRVELLWGWGMAASNTLQHRMYACTEERAEQPVKKGEKGEEGGHTKGEKRRMENKPICPWHNGLQPRRWR